MAKAQFLVPYGFLDQINSLESNLEPIIEDALEIGGEIMAEAVRDKLRAVVGQVKDPVKKPSRSKGDLVKALGVSPVKVDKNGNYNVKVGFSEPRSDGESNAKLANIIEYGKHGQPPRPFLKPAKNSKRKRVIEAMNIYMEQEIKKI